MSKRTTTRIFLCHATGLMKFPNLLCNALLADIFGVHLKLGSQVQFVFLTFLGCVKRSFSVAKIPTTFPD